MLQLRHSLGLVPLALGIIARGWLATAADIAAGAGGTRIAVDAGRDASPWKPVHGANFGPRCANGIVDLTDFHRHLGIPSTRLHDIPWTYGEVVDIHTLFRNEAGDPADPGSYDFRRTDDYILSVTNTGSSIVYRLGESIEHTPKKYWVHPPKDPARWAAICAGVVRHYNEGWAGGFRHGIVDWEIWNEPENQPACWTGSDAEYFRLYETTTRHLKGLWPHLRVGGPAVGNTGTVRNGRFEPSKFLSAFVTHCRKHALPLDFLSWHVYTDDPAEVVIRAMGIRELLDRNGFTGTRSYLDEWNYLPGKDWSAFARSGQGEPRERMFAEIGGAAGASFAASVLIRLLDAPVDLAHYFSADNQGFGLFTANGAPRKNYEAFLALRQLMEGRRRVATIVTGSPSVVATAGCTGDGRQLGILISNPADAATTAHLVFRNFPRANALNAEWSVVDTDRSMGRSRQVSRSIDPDGLRLELTPWSVTLVTVQQ